jgi:c-di-GMP-binding flagellar brake protein YcgR/DNA-binding NarL/FixJ family response regulator
MKTVVIIENEALELEALVGLFEQWQKKINILTAREERAAISIMSQHHVDLVVCDIAPINGSTLDDFSLLTNTFPYIPCIALSHELGFIPDEAVKRGASHCLEKPIDKSILLMHAEELLDTAASGQIKGIPIHSFLQMLETEEKTCTLQINRSNDTGLLYVKNGVLIGAETKNFTGESAAYLILSWQESAVRIRFFNGQRKRQINKPLISIIMEAFRLNGERDKLNHEKLPNPKHQLPLKHLSTLGKRIPLEIGSRVKLEFPSLDSLLDSEIVGMLQENCLIVTNPQPFSDLEDLIGGEQRVIMKYIHKGREWMFKAQLLKAVESPSHLLFFEYPGVIHFHELRKAKRTSIFIPCTFHINEEPELYGALIDLSMTGGLCQIKNKGDVPLPQIDINSSILLRCLLPGIKEEQQINGRVRNIQINPEEIKIGIEFENLQSHLADTIGQYLYSIESQFN